MTIKSKLLNSLSWLLLTIVGVGLSCYLITQTSVQQGGDIAEYYGLTQTILSERTLALSAAQETELEKRLHSAYFDNPQYFIAGRDGKRYPVHFFVYSLLAIPFRLGLVAIQQDPLKSLWLVNVWSLVTAVGIIWWRYVKSFWLRLALLIITVLSPLMSFFIWPGPDLWYLSILLIAVFAFMHREHRLSVAFTMVASWHSQPLIVLAGLLAVYDIVRSSEWHLTKKHQKLTLHLGKIWQYLVIGGLGLLPYAYNFYAFGSLTPWTLLQDGWTQTRGFGLQNASLQKTYEQMFDLNIGQFWYAPWLYIVGAISLVRATWKKQWYLLVLASCFLITAIFYQTNPGWHYGTSGYGPGRHSLLYIPLVIGLVFPMLQKKLLVAGALFYLILVTNLAALSYNNLLTPDLTKTLHHSVFAKYALDNFPQYYTPTPEIFVDRTNHDDQTLPSTAIYKNAANKCVKAWVLLSDKKQLEHECGQLTADQNYLLDDRFLRMSDQSRQVLTTQATFWPHPDACADWFYKTEGKPYDCMRTIGDVIRLTKLTDASRITTVSDYPYPGIWRIETGDPVLITIPPGYIIHHQSLEGRYVEFDQ